MESLRYWGPIAVLAGVIVVVFFVFKLRANRRVRALRAAFDPFHGGLVGLLESLEALEKRHDMLPFSDLDYSETMTGETRRAYEGVAAEADRLRTAWTALMEIRQQAATILDASRIDKDDEEQVRKLLERADELQALQERHGSSTQELDRLEGAHEALKPMFESFNALDGRIQERLEAIRGAGLSVVPYDDEWVGCKELLAEAQQTRVSDPLGTGRMLPDINRRTEELAAWLQSVTDAFATARNLEEDFGRARGDVDRWRADGLRLDSLRSNPDALLGDGEKRCGDAVRSLDYGDAEAAQEAIEAARECLEGARHRVEDVVNAKTFYEEELPGKVTRRDELEAAVPVAENQIAQLEEQNARRSWRHVQAHPAQARKVLERQEPLFDDAASAATDAEQDYLRAAELLRRLERQQEHAGYLLESVEECLTHLTELRTRCRERCQELAAEVRRLESKVGGQRAVLSDDVCRSLEDAVRLLDTVRGEVGHALPDWPVIEERVESVADELSRIERTMDGELEAHTRAQGALSRLRGERSRLEDFLRTHTEDRPATNKAFDAAKNRLEDLGGKVENGKGTWALLERELDTLGRDFEAVRRGADRDINLASEAQRAVADAEGLLKDAASRRMPGIANLVSQAESSLVESRRFLTEQAYERATVSASQARDEARRALEQATVAARAEEEQRRRKRMETMASAAAAGASVLAHVLRNSRMRGQHRGPWFGHGGVQARRSGGTRRAARPYRWGER